MSSNIRIKRICQYCGKDFEARKTTTKTCSDDCAKKLYKANKRSEKIKASNIETLQIIAKPLEELKVKQFLSIEESSKILGISRRTIYRMIERGEISIGKAGRRTIIRSTDFEKLFKISPANGNQG